MSEESKKARFIGFVDKTLSESLEEIKAKFPLSMRNISREPSHIDDSLNLKIKIRDIGYSRFISFNESQFSISEKPLNKVDCLIYFDNAKIVHSMLLGKILPYNQKLIGKYDIKYYNQRAKFFASIYIPAKNNYCKIIKGTRFTLKGDEQS